MNVSDKVKGYFEKVNTKHKNHRLQNGTVVDITSESVTDVQLRQLGQQSPDIFVPKPTKAADKAPAPNTTNKNKDK